MAPLSTNEMDAIVLAGGESKRMTSPKALLPWGDSSMLSAIVEALRPLFNSVFVVGKDSIKLPPLDVTILSDNRDLRGPLVGLATGLDASTAEWCFVTGCDMPFLDGDAITHMAEKLQDSEILALHSGGKLQPLHAFYSRACLPKAEALLDKGRTALFALLDECNVHTIDFASLMGGPSVQRFAMDVDTPEEYEAAVQLAQKSLPEMSA